MHNLAQNTARRVDVEVQGPAQRKARVILEGLDIGPVKGVIDTPRSQVFKAGAKLLPVHSFIELAQGTAKLLGRYVPALFGGEAEGSPIGLPLCSFVEIVKVIETMGRTDEQCFALPIRQCRPQYFRPGGGRHRSVFIEDHKVEALTTKRVVAIRSAQGNRAASLQLYTQIGFLRLRGPVRAR